MRGSIKWDIKVLQIIFVVEACSMSLWLDGEDTLKMVLILEQLKVNLSKDKLNSYISLPSEIMANVSFNWTSIVKELSLWSTSLHWIVVPGDKIQWRKIQTYTACQSVDVVDYFDFKKYTPLQLLITTYRQENMGFSVYIEESIKVMFLFAKILKLNF